MSNKDRFLRACRKQPVDRTPIWIMRQAGRYLPEYQGVRAKHDFLTICRTPDLATEVTLQPIDRLGVDAAILFADILTPLEGMGLDLDFAPGPIISNPARSASAIEALRVPDPHESTDYVLEAIRSIRSELNGRVPLIGFAGAPFTVAAYIAEGNSSSSFPTWRALLYREPDVATKLLDKVTDTTIQYLRAQIEAGAQAVQLFESWAGLLAPEDFDAIELPRVRQVFDGIRDLGVPMIYYAGGGAALLSGMGRTGADVIGVDWRTPLDRAWSAIGHDLAIQGNLDPCALFASHDRIEELAGRVLREAAGRPGHIFNLGHGILPSVPWENAKALVEIVHRLSECGEGIRGEAT